MYSHITTTTIKICSIPPRQIPLCLPLALVTTNLFYVSMVLPLPECLRVIQSVAFESGFLCEYRSISLQKILGVGLLDMVSKCLTL